MISITSRVGALVAAAGLAAPSIFAAPEAAAELASLPPSAVYGDYAVGAKVGFAVDNRQRFDPWNTAYASDAYRAMLRRVEASGQPRTVIFHLWYPAEADRSGDRLAGPRSPWPAVSGERAVMADFFFDDESFAVPVLLSSELFPSAQRRLHLESGGTLAELAGDARQEALESIGGELFRCLPRRAPISMRRPRRRRPRGRGSRAGFRWSSCPTGSAATTACGAFSASFWPRTATSSPRRASSPTARCRSSSTIPIRFRRAGFRRRGAGSLWPDHAGAEGPAELLPLHVRRRVSRRLQSGRDRSGSGRRAAHHDDDAESVSPARGRRGVVDPHREAARWRGRRLRRGAAFDGRDFGRARSVRASRRAGRRHGGAVRHLSVR